MVWCAQGIDWELQAKHPTLALPIMRWIHAVRIPTSTVLVSPSHTQVGPGNGVLEGERRTSSHCSAGVDHDRPVVCQQDRMLRTLWDDSVFHEAFTTKKKAQPHPRCTVMRTFTDKSSKTL